MNASAMESTEIKCGQLLINKTTREVTSGSLRGKLTVRELKMVLLLIENKNSIVSKAELLEKAWGYGYYGQSRAVDNQIRRLRMKIEPDPANPRYIMTKWGQGYYFKCQSR